MVGFIHLATEDELSENIAERLIREFSSFTISLKLRKGGNGYLRSKIASFYEISQREPMLLITDLDNNPCPPGLINQWCGHSPDTLPDELLFRIAVREVEAWLIADHIGFQNFIGRNLNLPSNADELVDPKAALLTFAKKAKKNVRSDIVAQAGSSAIQGVNYNNRLCSFVNTGWCPTRASQMSPSLSKAISAIRRLSEKHFDN